MNLGIQNTFLSLASHTVEKDGTYCILYIKTAMTGA